MALPDYRIKKIYLGTDLIRPKKRSFELDYDFRNKTWATVESDGWVLTQGTSWTTINSNGIVGPTKGQGDSNQCRIYYPIDCTDAASITLSCEYYGVAQSRGQGFGLRTAPIDISLTGWGTYIGRGTTTSSGYAGRWSAQTPNINLKYSNNPATGTYTSTATFDLVNKTISFTRSGLNELTGIIPDADIETIKNGKGLWINIGHDVGTLYIHTTYIKIEY